MTCLGHLMVITDLLRSTEIRELKRISPALAYSTAKCLSSNISLSSLLFLFFFCFAFVFHFASFYISYISYIVFICRLRCMASCYGKIYTYIYVIQVHTQLL